MSEEGVSAAELINRSTAGRERKWKLIMERAELTPPANETINFIWDIPRSEVSDEWLEWIHREWSEWVIAFAISSSFQSLYSFVLLSSISFIYSGSGAEREE